MVDYLLIGHITADLLPDGGRTAGGTVSYAARTAAAFELGLGIVTSTAPDEPLLATLPTYPPPKLVVLPAEKTTTYENLYPSTGRVQYVRGVAAPIRAADIPEDFRRARLVHFAPIADEYEPGELAPLFPDATILMTLQGLLRRWDADGRVHFKRWYNAEALQRIDIVVFSEEDIVEAPEMEAEFARSVRHLIVTRAEKGGTYYRDGVPTTYETPQAKLIHPTGAGDIFAVSLLASLPRVGWDYVEAIRVAARLGALSVTRSGLDSAPSYSDVVRALHPSRLTAKASDFRHQPLPESRFVLPVERELTPAQMAGVRRGLLPHSQDDRWFIYYQDGTLYIHRSWTGICIFQAQIEARGDGGYIREVVVNGDREQYRPVSEDEALRLLLSLLETLYQEFTIPL